MYILIISLADLRVDMADYSRLVLGIKAEHCFPIHPGLMSGDFILFIYFYVPSSRKPIVPQKEPSPLLEKKIQLLEAKFAELEGGDDDIEEMGEEDSEVIEPPSLPQLQTPLASELDLMPYTPPQVKVAVPVTCLIPSSGLQ